MAKNFRTLREKIRADPERRARVAEHKRAIDVAVALAELRENRGVTQQSLAAALATSQANVSRIEHGKNVYFSTLSRYVAALGGYLKVAAVFPDETIYLSAPPAPTFSESRESVAGTENVHAVLCTAINTHEQVYVRRRGEHVIAPAHGTERATSASLPVAELVLAA